MTFLMLATIFAAFFACAETDGTVRTMTPEIKTPVSVRGTVSDVFFDPVDTAFVFLVLDRGGHISYISAQTSDAAATLKSFQPFIGREVVVSGLEFKVPPERNRAVMKRQIGINSATDISFADKSEKDPFAVPALDDKPLSLDSIQSAGPRKAVGRVIARWSKNRVIGTTGDRPRKEL